MPDSMTRDAFLAAATVEPKVFKLRPDYRAMLIVIDGLTPAITDVYNAISALHQIPFGGEDFHRYQGPARPIRVTGAEPFDTTAKGEPVTEYPDAGEVVWCDDDGVTCRRWNWRQGRRTGLTDGKRTAFFILDALAPASDAELHAAADALVDALTDLGPGVRTTNRLIGAP
jgi:DNA/RNA-binding domain of Phe-tRNA-synthetase-like protein